MITIMAFLNSQSHLSSDERDEDTFLSRFGLIVNRKWKTENLSQIIEIVKL